MDPEEKFKRNLLHAQKKDMHLRFFREDPTKQYINIPIFSKLSPKKQITPFRNIECLKPTCVYDLQDLIEKFKASQMNSLHGFICYSCNTFVELQNFYLDYTLKKMIDSIWDKFNKTNKVVCNGVTVMRDGTWEPNLPEYLKYLDRNQAKRKGSDSIQFNIKGADENQITTIMEYENPPHIKDFDKAECKELYTAFLASKLHDNAVYINKNGIPLNAYDIKKLEEETVSERTVAMFVNYMNQLQKMDPSTFNKRNRNRCFFVAANVLNYDKFYKKVRFEYLFGYVNEYKKDPARLYQEHDKLLVIFKYDDRWMLAVIELASSRYYIVDFLAEDLSRVKYEEVLEVVKYIAQFEFKVKYESQQFYDQKRLNFICDCGIYVLNYAYKCLTTPNVDLIKIKPTEKDLFRRQLLWIFLKMKSLKKKQVQLFGFPGIKDTSQDQSMIKKDKDVTQDFLDFLGQDISPSPIAGRRKSDFSILSKSASVSTFNGNDDQIQPRVSIKRDPVVKKTTFKKASMRMPSFAGNQDSMIELHKSQLDAILDDFRQEVQTNVKKDKEKAKKKKDKKKKKKDDSSDSDDSDSSDDDSSDDEKSKKKHKKHKHKHDSSDSEDDSDDSDDDDDSSSDDSDDSDGDTSANSTLPSIYKKGYPPNYGMSPYGNFYGGGYSPYSPYGNGNGLLDLSELSSDSSDSDDDSKLSGSKLKKGKKKTYKTPDSSDVFNYSKDSKDKRKASTKNIKAKAGAKSKTARGTKLAPIDEGGEDDE